MQYQKSQKLKLDKLLDVSNYHLTFSFKYMHSNTVSFTDLNFGNKPIWN